MKKIITLFAIALLLITTTSGSYGQSANTSLSNLVAPTSINQSLLPNNNNKFNLGNSSKGWKKIFLTDGIYHDTFRVFFADTTNIAVGTNTLTVNTGKANTANGAQALRSNGSGVFNTGIGASALLYNISGSANTAVGGSTMYSNTTGNYNTATGFFAMGLNTTGSNNVAYGNNALYTNTIGHSNVAIGANAMYKNTIASNVIAIGDSALLANTDGDQNTAVGSKSLMFNSTGYGNTATGWGTLHQNNGLYNTAIGNTTLYSNKTGNLNTAVGWIAMDDNESGSYNTVIGASADVAYKNLTNAAAIGYDAVTDESNKIRIGNTNVLKIGGQVGWSVFSDGRYKQNIKENVPGLEFVNKLRPITYTVNIYELNKYYRGNVKPGSEKAKQLAKFDETMKTSYEQASKIVYTGFVAQEVEKASNELNYDFNGVDKPETKDNLYGLRYDEFVVPLVKAVQELSKKNDEKDAKIDDLQKQIDELKSLILSNSQTSNAIRQQISLSQTAKLEQNQPNPTAQSTTIKYFIPEQTTSAIIKIKNANGQEIKSINLSQKSNGQISLKTNDLTAGTYFYSLVTDGKIVDTKKMIIAY